ncbi:transcriptional regulator [Longispora sp. NPDC051575]|uniref:ArsR/SmtB family transcription factor n=1 Tax=Longispora sp. NPDC051575 TaxID=3154943 RepID=UPI003411FE6D
MSADVEHPRTADLQLERVLHALSDPIRLQIVRNLANCESLACGAMDYPVAKSTLSHHLRTLRLSGLTHTDIVGTQRFISLRHDDVESRFPGLLAVIGAVRDPQPSAH